MTRAAAAIARRRRAVKSATAAWAVALAVAAAFAPAPPARGETAADAYRRRLQDQLRTTGQLADELPPLAADRVEDVLLLRPAGDGTFVPDAPAVDAVDDPQSGYRLALDGFDGVMYLEVDPVVATPRDGRPAGGGRGPIGPRPPDRPATAPTSRPAAARRQPLGPPAPRTLATRPVGASSRPATSASKPAGPAAGTARRFVLTRQYFLGPDALATSVLQSAPGLVNASRNVQRGQGNDIVQLVDRRDPADPAVGTVRLWVIRSGPAFPEPVSVSVEEPDLPTLFRAHRPEVEAHVRPLLRELGQEHLLAPDWRVAWQVLADAWPADPAAARRVADLLPALDDPSFRRRDRGVADLAALGRDGAAALRRLDRAHLSAEQDRLVGLALAPFAQLPPAEARRLAGDRGFLLDCLCLDDPPIRRAAAARLKATGGGGGGGGGRAGDGGGEGGAAAFDPDAPVADRLAVVRRWRQAPAAEGPSSRPAR